MIHDLQTSKSRCLADLVSAMSGTGYRSRLDAIDGRLTAYIDDALSGEASHANLYELLGIRKVLRLMDSYRIDADRTRRTLRAIEGRWQNGRHVSGGLAFDTPRGNMHVQLMPYQVWCIFGIYGFQTEVSMERPYHEGDTLLPTEFRGEDGNVWDRRRLTQEAHLFQTRKSGKTEFGGAIDFVEVCFLGPANGQALICSPSAETSQIAYRAIKEFASQVDPTCLNRMGGKFFRMTRNGMNWQPGHRMKGDIRTMAAGKTPKDGLYASVVHADEHGQARYINGRSDMQAAVETCWGSTGPRREKLLIHTTTAGNVSEGPYKSQIENVEQLLLDELEIPLDGQPHRTDNDHWFALLFRLDPWEVTDDLDRLDSPELFKKVNRSIGTTVQPTYYRERLHAARHSDDTKKEVLTKDFNLWQQARVTKWISGDRIRPLQRPRRITDCNGYDGWRVWVGLDFSHGDDLFAVTYLGVDFRPGDTMAGRFFADTTAWVLEKTMNESPNRPLYELWVSQGWLHVCPGEVFDSTLAINEIATRLFAPDPTTGLPDTRPEAMRLNIIAFGYDPAQSVAPINNLKAWLQSLGFTADQIKQMVIPVPQSALSQTPVIAHLEEMILSSEPWLEFSESPLWPWQFGNTACEVTTTDLRRLCKGGTHLMKMDSVAALVDATYLFDLSEGRVTE